MKKNLLIASVLFAASSLFAADIYVSESYNSADSDGSKTKPYKQLYSAINAASSDDVIHIAEGKYLPQVSSNGVRYSFFTIEKNITLIGGYNSSFAENDASSYTTILSGDMDNNDTYNRRTGICSNNEGNSYHVVYINDAIKFNASNLTIQGGNADLNNADGLPKSQSGGAIFTDNGIISLDNVIIKGNNSTGKAGAGIYSGAGFSGNKVTFMGNVTGNDGGGLYVRTGKVTLTNSTFLENTANSGGGAMMIQGNSANSYIANNIFYYNTTSRYGTISVYSITDDCTVVFVNNTIINNSVTNSTNKSLGGGSAIYLRGSDSNNVYLVNNTIVGNMTLDGTDEGEGGAVYNRGVTLHLANNIIAGNYCAVVGDDIYNNTGVIKTLGYNIFSSNTFGAISATLEGDTSKDIFAGTDRATSITALSNVLEGSSTAYVFEAEQADNGGATATVKIKSGTAAIGGKTIATIPAIQLSEMTIGVDLNNNGNKDGSLTKDQRGATRDMAGKACVGAYEIGIVSSNNIIERDNDIIQQFGKSLNIISNEKFTCNVYSMTGKVYIQTSSNSVDLNNLQKGFYIVSVKLADRKITKKIAL